MRKPSEVIINGKTLEEILENHKHWLMQDVEGWEEMRADIRNADLSYAYLNEANLMGVRFINVDFYRASFIKSNLSRVYINNSNLSHANLSEAMLDFSDILNSRLDFAVFYNSNLAYSSLKGSSLVHTDLQCANLRYTDFSDCTLRDTKISEANLLHSNFVSATDIPYIPLQCPSDGAFIGWKKVRDTLIKLAIPEDAKRSSATTNKCRCDKAKVLGFYDLDSNELDITSLVNYKHERCEYIKGEMVYPDSFDENRWNQCSHGIHFFINKQDAINYDC